MLNKSQKKCPFQRLVAKQSYLIPISNVFFQITQNTHLEDRPLNTSKDLVCWWLLSYRQKSMELCASSAQAQLYPVWLFRARRRHIPGQGTAAPGSLLSHSTATGGRVNTDFYCMCLLHCILQRVSCCNRLFKTLAK